MREVVYGEGVEIIELNEVFKYVTNGGTEYILMCVHDGQHPCEGCVFSASSNHPLKYLICTENSLACGDRIYKSVDQVLEDL